MKAASRAGARIEDRLARAVDASREEAIAFTADLVRMPTENPPGGEYRACVDRLATKLEEVGAQVEVVETSGEPEPPRSAVIAVFGRGPRVLYFHGHYDVVPAHRRDQFEPRRRGGSLFGRGASDMKGGLASMIYAVRALRDARIDLDGRIALVIVPDEETGGALGSGRLAAAGLLDRDAVGMLTPEPTSGAVWNACRGAVSLEVTVKGKAAHVGLEHRGVNAMERALPVLRALLGLRDEVRRRATAYAVHPETARRSILLVGGRCEGGTNFNMVPEAFTFSVDRRFNPEEDLVEEREKLLRVLEGQKRSGVDLEVKVIQEGASAGVPEDHPVARALAASVEAVTGRRPAFGMCPGLLEIRVYAALGVPAFAYGPGLLTVSHGPREFVKTKDIAACTAVYALAAARLLSEGGDPGGPISGPS